MVLVTGSNGKVGTSVLKLLKKKRLNFVQTIRSKNYKVINNSCIGLDLLNKNHIRKIFKKFNFNHLIHLAVTRNPLQMKEIRNFSTLEQDTLMMINLLKFCNNLKSISFTSSASVYALPDVKDSVKREVIANKIINFLLKKNRKKIKIETISKKKRRNLKVDPIFHLKANKRLNATSKLINELILISFCFEKNISLYILRPFYVIETQEEKVNLKQKIKLIRMSQK